MDSSTIYQLAETAVVWRNACQKPAELAALLSEAWRVNPKVILEIGVDAGGTSWAFRRLFPAAQIIGVDLPTGKFASPHKRTDLVDVIYGDSHRSDTLERVWDILDGRAVDVLFIDGDHRYEGVSADTIAYFPFVRTGGIAAYHDIVPHPNNPEVGVWKYWQVLKARWGDQASEFISPGSEPDWGGIGVIQK